MKWFLQEYEFIHAHDHTFQLRAVHQSQAEDSLSTGVNVQENAAYQQIRYLRQSALFTALEGKTPQPGQIYDGPVTKEESPSFAPIFRQLSIFSTFESVTSNGHVHVHKRSSSLEGWLGRIR